MQGREPDWQAAEIQRIRCELATLEASAAELKTEVHHMKRALRATQSRMRRLNARLERARQGRPMLRLVVSR